MITLLISTIAFTAISYGAFEKNMNYTYGNNWFISVSVISGIFAIISAIVLLIVLIMNVL